MRLHGSVAVVSALLALLCSTAAHGSPPLPAPFTQYAQAQVLKQIFPSYDPRTQKIIDVKNDDGTAASIEWGDARTWYANGGVFLAVVTSVSVRGGLCGVCYRRFYVTLLEIVHGRLTVTATGISQEYGGHRGAALDPAPYRLNGREMLLGLRITHIWWIADEYNEVLELYRVTPPHIDPVFRTLSIERHYQHGIRDPIISKRVTVVSIDQARPYNRLSLTNKIYRCRNGIASGGVNSALAADCSVDAPTSQNVWQDNSYWKFDGHRFIEETGFEQQLYMWGN